MREREREKEEWNRGISREERRRRSSADSSFLADYGGAGDPLPRMDAAA